jgi:hypothetical protein
MAASPRPVLVSGGWPVFAAATLMVVTLAGCSDEPAPTQVVPDLEWQPSPCDPHGLTTPSLNAPPLPAFATEPETFAKRFLYSAGDSLSGPAQRTELFLDGGGFTEWPTKRGAMRILHDDAGRVVYGSYENKIGWPGLTKAAALYNATGLLGTLGIPLSQITSLRVHTDHEKSVRGDFMQQDTEKDITLKIGGTFSVSKTSRLGTMTVERFHDLTHAEATLDWLAAQVIAYDFMTCLLLSEGKTPGAGYKFLGAFAAGMTVEHDSLVYVFDLSYAAPPPAGHCDGIVRQVSIDAVTGAVHGAIEIPCH